MEVPRNRGHYFRWFHLPKSRVGRWLQVLPVLFPARGLIHWKHRHPATVQGWASLADPSTTRHEDVWTRRVWAIRSSSSLSIN